MPDANAADTVDPVEEDWEDALADEDADDEGGFVPLRPRRTPKPAATDWAARFEAEAPAGTETNNDFIVSYQPSRHERGWLLESLRLFHEQSLITDVLAQVKGGKEASVYRCAAHSNLGIPLVAAKVYRPRQFRNLRNDALYREGRPVLTAEGRKVKNSDQRIMRALGKKTDFGAAVQHTSWLMYEHTTLEELHRLGAAVPLPYAAGENALLMDYIGDEDRAASTLSEVSLETEEAQPLFGEVLRNIELMLKHGRIHGDLSAYNILYWEGKITLIDFPQVTLCESNPNAAFILERDVTRICEYFARHGVSTGDPAERTARLWKRYV